MSENEQKVITEIPHDGEMYRIADMSPEAINHVQQKYNLEAQMRDLSQKQAELQETLVNLQVAHKYRHTCLTQALEGVAPLAQVVVEDEEAA